MIPTEAIEIDWADKLNAAVDYIEQNLAGQIDMAQAARLAQCSEYHLMRHFSFIADLPLGEYIRRRRLTLAGFMLQRSPHRIIDIASRFGYDSPNSFGRAFQAMHGLTPTQARQLDARLQAHPRINFHAKPPSPQGLVFRIEHEGPRVLFGCSFTTPATDAYRTVPQFIDRCEGERITNRIVEAGGGDERTCLKSLLWDADDGMVRYMLCLDLPPGGVPGQFELANVPQRTWAVFPLVIEHPGQDHIIGVWQRIWTEWFLESGYELDTGPRQERCRWGEDGKMIVEAWVPVVKQREQPSQSTDLRFL